MIMRCFCDQPVMLHWLSLWLLHLPKLLLLLLVFLQQLLRLLLLLVFLQQLLDCCCCCAGPSFVKTFEICAALCV